MPTPLTTIGKMRHRVTVQSLTNTADGQGGFVESWTDFTPDGIWAELIPAARMETNFGGRIQTGRSHIMNIRYLEGLTTTMRVAFQGRIFQIKGDVRSDERRFFMRVNLEEYVGT